MSEPSQSTRTEAPSSGIKPCPFCGSPAVLRHTPDPEVLVRPFIECTGVGQLVFDAIGTSTPGSIVCLTGISSGGRPLAVDMAALNKSMVLENDVVFGSVNANRRHYEAAAAALAKADRAWLERIITRRVPLENWKDILDRREGDVKIIVEF